MAKKKGKNRGGKTHGRGSGKHGRGAGERGGHGKAGSTKHESTGTFKQDPDYRGSHGFSRPEAVTEEKETINVREIDEDAASLVEDGPATGGADEVTLDLSELGVDKLLGGGQVRRTLHISVDDATDSAIRKIEEAGGSVTVTGETEDDADDEEDEED
jgi:large subunit ribosomal protein L15